MPAAAARCAATATSGSGPRDVDGDPIGGRSLAEFALEARIRLKAFGGNFGIVPFFDGGTLSTKSLPDFGDWQFGAGIGLRYYSSFGPIRVDVGTPLNPPVGRQPGRGRRLARPGLLMAEVAVHEDGTGRGPAVEDQARTGRGGWRASWRPCWSQLMLLLASAWSLLDTAPGHRWLVDRIGRGRDQVRPEDPDRPDRGLDLRRKPAAQRPGARPARACS